MLRTASIASRPVLSSPKSTSRLFSNRALLPSRPVVSSFAFQRRFNTDEAKTEAVENVENVAESAEEPFAETATSTLPEQDGTIDSADAQESTAPASEGIGWQIEPNNTIYVGNLFFDAKEDDIRDFFSKYGQITKIDLVTDIRGYSKG